MKSLGSSLQAPKLAIIAALSRNNVIGHRGQVPWNLPADMAHFKALTLDHAIVMGSKTYHSLPASVRPLPKRLNLVISRTSQVSTENLSWVTTPEEAHAKAEIYASQKGQDLIYVGGGGEIYSYFLPRVDRMYLTHVDTECDGDAFFPSGYTRLDWHKTVLATHDAHGDQPGFTIVQYDRV